MSEIVGANAKWVGVCEGSSSHIFFSAGVCVYKHVGKEMCGWAMAGQSCLFLYLSIRILCNIRLRRPRASSLSLSLRARALSLSLSLSGTRRVETISSYYA
jgi:hypothetical protein